MRKPPIASTFDGERAVGSDSDDAGVQIGSLAHIHTGIPTPGTGQSKGQEVLRHTAVS